MYWKKKNRSEVFYCNETINLDIETAWNHKPDNPVTWMVSCKIIFLDQEYLFRTPLEVCDWYNSISQEYNLDPEHRIITIIHNASFDLSYLLPYFRKYLPEGKQYGIFDSPNKCILWRMGSFEFRCTWRLTNASLYKWSNEMQVDHIKQIGLYDYDRVLYQDSELSKNDLKYDTYDVLAMSESWKKQLRAFGDDITTVPLTSTGYVRRLLRKATRKDPYYRQNYFWDTQLTLEQMDMCFNAFAGGYTHVNRWIKDEIIKPPKGFKGRHGDFRTGYLTQLVTHNLPWGRPIDFYDIKNPYHRMVKMNVEKILSMHPQYFSITKLHIYNMALKDKYISMPYMQVSKMFNRSEDLLYFEDNGRLLNITQGHFVTYLDNYQLAIIKDQYKFQYVIEKVLIFENKPIPEVLREPIDKLFIHKSNYKKAYHRVRDELGEFDPLTINALSDLTQNKKLYNAIYGCFVTSPLKVNYMNVENIKERTQEDRRKQLQGYYHNMNNFLPYQVGIAITTLQRYELWEYIKTIGYENCLYSDTDSIIYLANKEIDQKVKALNAAKHKKAPFVVDEEGEKIYYDVFEAEPDWIAFKGLHSKCYGVIQNIKDKEELKVTIAGVPERTLIGMKKGKPIYLSREEELAGISKSKKLRGKAPEVDPWKGLEALEDSFKFHTNAGITCKYVHHFMGVQEVDGHKVETAGGMIIIPLKEKVIKDYDLVEGFDYYVEYNSTDGVIDND